MKAVLIVHNEALETDVNEALESIGIKVYTKFTNTLGKGQLSQPHLDTDVWPGKNCGTLVVIDDSQAREIMGKIRLMRKEMGKEGLKAFMWPIEDIT
jgi:nitrogen regulatory protein PII